MQELVVAQEIDIFFGSLFVLLSFPLCISLARPLPGSERVGCGGDEAGDCNLCPSGEFKVQGITGGVYTDECQSCTACPLGKERGDASDPCVRTGGGSASDTSTCTGCNAGFYQNVAPTARNPLYYPSNPLLDKCEACEECLPGGSRAGCGNADAGNCAPWGVPTITGVSGSGKDGGSTTGMF